MTTLEAKVVKIEREDILHILTLDMQGVALIMTSLELLQGIEVDTFVKLSIKPINIALMTAECDALSFSNQIPALICGVTNGRLLSSVELELEDGVHMESIITRESAKRLQLQESQSVRAIIKATDISIVEVLG